MKNIIHTFGSFFIKGEKANEWLVFIFFFENEEYIIFS